MRTRPFLQIHSHMTMTLYCSVKRDQVCGHGKRLRHVQPNLAIAVHTQQALNISIVHKEAISYSQIQT